MNTIDLVGLAGAPLIVALVQVCKAWVDDDRLYPILALGFGLALNLGLAYAGDAEAARAVVQGLIAGLAASGLYSGAKAILSS